MGLNLVDGSRGARYGWWSMSRLLVMIVDGSKYNSHRLGVGLGELKLRRISKDER